MKLNLVDTPTNVRPSWTKHGPICYERCPSFRSLANTFCYIDDATIVQGGGGPCPVAVALMAERLREVDK